MTTTLPQPTKRTRPTGAPGGKPDVKPGTKPSVKPGAKPGTRPGAKPGTRPGARPAARPAARPRPSSRAPRTPFVLLIVGLLGGALVSLLLLNTVLAEDAFRLNDLQRQNTELLQREQSLKVDVKKAESPTELARRARELGMRPGPMSPQFADAQHPAIGTAARYGEQPKKKHKKKAHPSASPSAHASRTAKPHNGQKRHRGATPAPSTSGDGAFAGGGR